MFQMLGFVRLHKNSRPTLTQHRQSFKDPYLISLILAPSRATGEKKSSSRSYSEVVQHVQKDISLLFHQIYLRVSGKYTYTSANDINGGSRSFTAGERARQAISAMTLRQIGGPEQMNVHPRQ